MSFLSIAFLAALPLAAAPLLLHLFDRRRNVAIEWGAMEFLLEAATQKTSARRLKQWLLLLLRVLAVAALVMALARPLVKGNWFGNSERCELILVIDNSMSTQRQTDDDSNLFSQIIDSAISELDELNRGDSVRILAASPYPVWATAGSLNASDASQDFATSQLEAIRPTDGSSDLLAALFTAVQSDHEPTVQRRRIVLLTDGQAADWTTDDKQGWRRFREVMKQAQLATELNVIEVADRTTTSNVAVASITARSTVVGVDQPFAVSARVLNNATVSTSGGNIGWLIDGHEEDTDQLPGFDGQKSRDISWQHSFSKPGVFSVTCEVDADDSLNADNRSSIVVEVVNEVPVLIVDAAAGRTEMQQDGYFVQAAMGYPGGEPLPARGVHQPEIVRPESLSRISLESYRAIVVPNLQSLPNDVLADLKQYVVNGGGLWLGLGPRTDIDEFNQFLYANGDGLSPLALDKIVAESNEEDRRTTINPTIRDHPATKAISDTERLDTADIAINKRIRFVPPTHAEDVSVLLNLSNGEPLAVERYVGRGRVIVMGVPLRLNAWSELARSQAFVVMVQDWMSYLTQPQATRHNLSPGDPIVVHQFDAEHFDAILKTPNDDEIDLTADSAGDGVVFRSSRTILPGDYSLELGLSGDTIPFHVKRDARESNLATMSDDEKKLLTEASGLTQYSLSEGMSAPSHSDPIWPLLLMFLIAFMAGDVVLSGLISRERFGGEEIAESSEQFSDRHFGVPSSFGSQASTTFQSSNPMRAEVASEQPLETTNN